VDHGVAPAFVDWGEHRTAVRAAMRADPKDLALRHMVLTMLGLEPGKTRGGLGSYWSGKRRPRRSKGWLVDPAEGMPLSTRHVRTGMELRWIPVAIRAAAPAVRGRYRDAGGGYLGRHPVTVGEWARFLEAVGAPATLRPRGWSEQEAGDPGRPVVRASREQAAEFCAWAGGCLPGEYDWEWAARGSVRRQYPWGNRLAPKDAVPGAWWTEVSRSLDAAFPDHWPHANQDWPLEPPPPPVGRSPGSASPFGVEEMSGLLVEPMGDSIFLRGGALAARWGRAPGHPWALRAGLITEQRRAADPSEYPALQGLRLWIPVDGPMRELPR
jgi:hypothetical protein